MIIPSWVMVMPFGDETDSLAGYSTLHVNLKRCLETRGREAWGSVFEFVTRTLKSNSSTHKRGWEEDLSSDTQQQWVGLFIIVLRTIFPQFTFAASNFNRDNLLRRTWNPWNEHWILIHRQIHILLFVEQLCSHCYHTNPFTWLKLPARS